MYIIPSAVGQRLADYGLLNFVENSDTMALAAHLQGVTADELKPRLTEALGINKFPLPPKTIEVRKVIKINRVGLQKLQTAFKLVFE